MGELYLYFSVWFDNCHEIPSFSPLIHLREKPKESDQNSEENTKNDESMSHDDNDLFDEKATYEEYGHDDVPSDDLGPGLRPGPNKGRPGVRLHGVRARTGMGAGTGVGTGLGTRAGTGAGAGFGGKSPMGPRSSARTWDNSESKGEHSGGQGHTPGKVRAVLYCNVFVLIYHLSYFFSFSLLHYIILYSVLYFTVCYILICPVLSYFISFINFYLTYYTTATTPYTHHFHIWYGIQGISFEPYGSVAYLEQLRNRISDFEFLLVMGHISMECSMDLDYFPKEPSSAVYLQKKEEVRLLRNARIVFRLILIILSFFVCLFDGSHSLLFYHVFLPPILHHLVLISFLSEYFLFILLIILCTIFS